MSDIVHIQHQFGDHLFNFIRSKVSSWEDAQDIYQEVILKIMNKSNQLKKAESLKSWLFTIARNQIIDFYRSNRLTMDIDSIPPFPVPVEEKATAYYELENCLSSFIAQLPEDYRQLIILSEIEGKSQKELSKSLNINYVTLRSKIQRGREKIKKMLFDACLVEKDTAGRFVDCTPKLNSSSCGADEEGCGCDSV